MLAQETVQPEPVQSIPQSSRQTRTSVSVPEKVNESAAQLPKTAWKDTGQTFGDSRSRSFDKRARNQTQSSADHHHEKPADLTANRISSRVCAPICSSPSRNVVIEPEVGPVPGWSERGRSNRGAEGDRKDVTGDIAETLDCIRQSQTGSKLQECVFRDQSWAKWFVSTYEKSTKPEHLKCLRFVSLKMTKGRKASTMIKKMELSMGVLSLAAPEPGLMAQLVDAWAPNEINVHDVLDHLEQQDLRTSRIENALSAIIQHLEHQKAPSKTQ